MSPMVLISFPYSQPGPRFGAVCVALWEHLATEAGLRNADEYCEARPGYRVHVYPQHMTLVEAKARAIRDRAACVA